MYSRVLISRDIHTARQSGFWGCLVRHPNAALWNNSYFARIRRNGNSRIRGNKRSVALTILEIAFAGGFIENIPLPVTKPNYIVPLLIPAIRASINDFDVIVYRVMTSFAV
jgi:hypothetical protein